MTRPWPIRVVAILLLGLGLLGLGMVLVPSARADVINTWAVSLRYLGMLVAGIGLWRMEKWGLYAYLGFWLLQVVIFVGVYGGISQIGPPWVAILGPIIVCVAVLPYWGKLK